MQRERRGFKLPHVYIILMMVMVLIVGLSWIVPSGQFAQIQDPVTGQMIIDPSNFNHIVNDTPIRFMDFFKAIHQGIVQSGDIIINLLIVSGVLYMIDKSGAISAGVHKILSVAKGKEIFVIALLTLVFTVLGAIGFEVGGLPFIPLAMSIVMSLGYDRIAGIATAILGLGVGFASGVLNLYTTGISQNIVGLPMFSGTPFRIGALICFYIIVVTYIILYCKKIKKDPSKSIVAAEYMNQKTEEAKSEAVPMTIQRAITLILLGVIFVVQAYGASQLGWGMAEISALYIMFAIVITILFKLNPSGACITFATGASALIPAALTIGLARSVMLLMNQAKIVDTAINSLASALNGKGTITALVLVYVAVIAFNFFVVSGSGKAVIMMPILGPLGRLLGINQQVMVLVYQYGDGFTNYLWPTSGTLMAALSMCDVEWQDWAKFSWKIFMILAAFAFGVILFANGIGLGPF